MTSAERGTNVSMIAAVNALGNTVPPLFVFPRVHFKSNMLKGAPPGSIGAAAPSGWSNENIFNQYFEHFVKHTKPTIESPVILLLDNHESHVSVRAITLAKKVGVHMVTFYPHTSHKMQPLDCTVFGPFKTYYHKAITDWMTSPGNQGKPLTIYDVAEIAGKVYSKAFTPSNIIEGFKVTGIFPLDQDIFKDHEFLPANVTDRPAPTSSPCLQDRQVDLPSESQQPSTSSDVQPSTSSDVQPSTSSDVQQEDPSTSPKVPASTPSHIITPEMLRPFPKAEACKSQGNTKCRPKGKSKIMTDTPEKDEIENMKKIKMEGKQRKGLKKITDHMQRMS
ncbi:uncharacterized protein LOC111052802 [Nilaparvata lugens]|uniref:uncharacterized protein LOC111052802 n=1 Tax=Nilaparvata lugens TaxID=108931 RepID=UPI00193D31EF|nr:uncharacterized protein LOC111052802 [Nilaparvata lugens]